MKENQGMRLSALPLVFLIPAMALAQEPPSLSFPSWQRTSRGVRLSGAQKPSAVYFRSAPERLVVEYAGVQLAGGPPAAPTGVAGLSEVRWRQSDLSHVSCEIGLAYRLPSDALKLDGQGLELELDYQWEDRYRLAPGVLWTRCERAIGGRYVLWNEILVDPSQSGAGLEIGLAKERVDAREKPTEMVSRYGAVGGVNGGYFNTAGGPLGVVVKAGKILSPHVGHRPPRTTLGVMKDHRVEFEQMVAQKGVLASRSGQTWSDVELALGGGPRLLRRGRLALTTDEEALGPSGNDITRVCARTAVATTRDGKVLIATASGYRDNHLQGLRLEELAEELQRRGCNEAMNLDGGASTTMAVGNQVVSAGPAAPRAEKAVATTLLVMGSSSGTQPASIELSSDARELAADGQSTFEIQASVKDAAGRSVPDGTPVRFYAQHLTLEGSAQSTTRNGSVRIRGRSLCSPGDGNVRVECGAARQDLEIKMTPGPLARIWTLVQPVAGMPGKLSLTVQAVDNWKNPVRACSFESSEGGTAQTTGANGQTTFEVFRMPGSPASSLTLKGPDGQTFSVAIPAVAGLAQPVPTPGPSPSATPPPGPPPEDPLDP